jgi:hypothetical protein
LIWIIPAGHAPDRAGLRSISTEGRLDLATGQEIRRLSEQDHGTEAIE